MNINVFIYFFMVKLLRGFNKFPDLLHSGVQDSGTAELIISKAVNLMFHGSMGFNKIRNRFNWDGRI